MSRRARSIDVYYDRRIDPVTRTYFLDPNDADHAYRSIWLLAQAPDPLTIHMNHPGGSVIDWMGVFNLVSRLPNHVTIRAWGQAQSMGAILLQAADHRAVFADTTIMFHHGNTAAEDTQDNMLAYAKWVSATKLRRMQILSERTGKPVSYYRKKLAKDWYLTPRDALNESLIDEIILVP